MNKTYLIFKHEFLHAIKRVGFIIMTLIVPVLALLGIGIFKLVTNLTKPPAKEITAIGYVDIVFIGFRSAVAHRQGFGIGRRRAVASTGMVGLSATNIKPGLIHFRRIYE